MDADLKACLEVALDRAEEVGDGFAIRFLSILVDDELRAEMVEQEERIRTSQRVFSEYQDQIREWMERNRAEGREV